LSHFFFGLSSGLVVLLSLLLIPVTAGLFGLLAVDLAAAGTLGDLGDFGGALFRPGVFPDAFSLAGGVWPLSLASKFRLTWSNKSPDESKVGGANSSSLTIAAAVFFTRFEGDFFDGELVGLFCAAATFDERVGAVPTLR